MEKYHKILLLLVSVFIILFYSKIFPSYNSKETFVSTNSNISDFIEANPPKTDDNQIDDTNTVNEKKLNIYEQSLVNVLSKNNEKLICNTLPYLTCENRKNFPVHIIKLITGEFLAVFNDGKLYSTDNLKKNIWIGPLENSLPDNEIMLHTITTNPEGNILFGIGANGKVYMKKQSLTELLNLTSKWVEMIIEGFNQEILYMMFYFKDGTAKKILVDLNGNIHYENEINNFIKLDIPNMKPVLKMFLGIDGYMYGINTNLRLFKFNNKNWTNSTNISTNISVLVNDVIYDNDGKLIAIAYDLTKDKIVFKKQRIIGFNNLFFDIDENEFINKLIMDSEIISSKLGMNNLLGLYNELDKSSIFDKDINLAKQRQFINDNKKLREFCSKRQNNISADFIDVQFSNKLKDTDSKIKKINQLLDKLSGFN